MTLLAKLGVQLTADHSGFLKGMQASGQAVDDFNKKVEQTDKSMAKWLKGTATEINSFMSIAGRIAGVFREIYQVAEEGARAASAEKFFVNAGKSIDEYRKATMGLVSDADLLKKSNLADSMGINEATFKQLAVVAHAAAVKTGQSFDYMFNSIIVGTARSSRLLLDNLGIIVSVKQANLHYAQALKQGSDAQKYASLTAEQLAEKLNDVQKKAAFAEEVMLKSQGTLKEYEKIGGTAADNFDRWAAAVDNLKLAIGKVVAEGGNSPLVKMAALFNQIATDIQTIQKFGKMDMPAASAMLAGGVTGGVGGGSGEGMLATLLAGPFAPLVSAVGSAVGVGGGVADAAEKNQHKAQEEFAFFAESLVKVGANLRAVAGYTEDQISVMESAAAKYVRKFQELNAALGNPVKPLSTMPDEKPPGEDKPPGGDGPKEEKPYGFAGGTSGYEMEEKARQAVIEAIEAELQAQGKEREFWDELNHTRENQLKIDEANVRLMEQENEARKRAVLDQNIGTGINLAGAAIGGDAAGFFGQLATIIGTAVGGAATGTAIGAILGPLLAPLDSVAGLFEHIVKGASSLIDLGLKPLLDTLQPLGPALEFLLAAVGQLVGSALRPLLPIIGLIINGISAVISLLAGWFIVLSPIVEVFSALFVVISSVAQLIWSIIQVLGGGNLSFAQAMRAGADIINQFTKNVAQGAVNFNNAIVGFIRGLGDHLMDLTGDDFGLGDFGRMLELEDLLAADVEATEENTDSTRENTRAVRDLTREFRNLPQGYKVNYAIYESTAARSNGNRTGGIGEAHPGVRDNFRWRI